MTANRYGNLLTVLLVILIVAILVGLSFLVYSVVKSKNIEEKTKEAIAEFEENINGNDNENYDDNEELESDLEDANTIAPPTTSFEPTGEVKKKTYYEGYVMIGYITIPKTNVKLPILDSVSPDSLNTAVAALYPSNPQLNEPGNVVIIGHNYRNGKFFSDNDRLSIGDKVLIKDTTGRELSYTIYQKFQTTEQDTSFYTRDTNGVAEITLSTCTDDSKARIIILAKAD